MVPVVKVWWTAAVIPGEEGKEAVLRTVCGRELAVVVFDVDSPRRFEAAIKKLV